MTVRMQKTELHSEITHILTERTTAFLHSLPQYSGRFFTEGNDRMNNNCLCHIFDDNCTWIIILALIVVFCCCCN